MAASVLVLGLVALPSTASPGDATHLQMMEAATSATSSGADATDGTRSPSQAAPEDSAASCFADAAGDEQQDFNSPQPADEPRTDILEHCVAFGPTLRLSVRVDQHTDPLTDQGWQRATFVGWYLDTDDDGEGDYFVDLSLERGEDEPTLGASVQELRSGETGVETCSQDLSPNDTGSWYSVSNIDPSCIGDAQSVSVQAAMFYEDEDGDENFDTAPDGGQFTAEVASSDRTTRRLGGQDRIETSIEISQEQFPTGSEHVYLARGDLFADAVAGGVLTRGPIILVPSCGPVPSEVVDEVNRLDPQVVYALGGTDAICGQVLRDAADGHPTNRIFGRTRIQTAVEISQFQFRDPAAVTEVYLARSDIFADAVAGGVLTDGPILLVPRCGGVPAEVQQEIGRVDPDVVYALGGPEAICEATLDAASVNREDDRLAGPTRIGTAIAISQHQFPQAAGTVYLARERPDDQLADSVAGGSLTDGPVLLVPTCGELPDEVAGEISRVAPTEVIALGERLAICDDMLRQAGNA